MPLPRLVIAAAILAGCTRAAAPTLTPPTRLCSSEEPSCRSVESVEALLAGDLKILTADRAGGLQRASVLTLRSSGPHPVVFRAKWRAQSTTTATNSPRFELAAYAVQKLFLSPAEYVVPPTASHCFPLAMYRDKVDETAAATRSGCVDGVLSYWLEDVTTVYAAHTAGWFHGLHRHMLDRDLFARDTRYRDSVAHVNLLTYLIDHGDSHSHNFVVARDAGAFVIYSVDNSKSFTLAHNPGIEPRHDWSAILVPSLPRAAIDRLRRADLSTLVNAGLTEREIAGMRTRLALLLDRVDRYELLLY